MFTIKVKNVFSTTLTTEMLIKLMPLTLHFHHFTIGRHHCFQLPVEKKMTKENIGILGLWLVKTLENHNLFIQEN